MDFYQYFESQENDIERWLGNSTVRQPVYHGTNAQFNDFQKMKTQRGVLFSMFDVQAQGFFFSESKKEAAGYGRRVITCYVKLTNPLVDPRRDKKLSIDRLPNQKEIHLAYILRNLIKKDKTYGKYIDLWVSRHYIPDDFARTRTYDWVYEFITTNGIKWDVLDDPLVVNSMKKLGYDGTFTDEPEDHTGRSIFVLDASQIKIVEYSWLNNRDIERLDNNDQDDFDDYELDELE